jgi:ABC-2 type transport system ATP-binding protein
MVVLRTEGLKKRFGAVHALRGVSRELRRGQALGVVGPNGAGKTTLLHIILGLITPTEGLVECFGLELWSHRSQVLRRMNFASNYAGLPLSLTPWENLMVYALMYEVPRARRRCQEMLQRFGLWHLRDVPSRRLSSGQMMRLALAKALLNEPELLLLDEPTAGLDPSSARASRQMLRELKARRGLSLLYTSHNLAEIQEVADEVMLIWEGQVAAHMPTQELLRRYRSLEEFFFRRLRQ